MTEIPKYQGQLVAYIRVSSYGQCYETQRDAVLRAGAHRIFEEKASATTLEKRPQLAELLRHVREGDTVIITKIDRLARSVYDLQAIVKDLHARKIGLRILDQHCDTSTPAGKLFLDMIGAFAEFENTLRRERQMAGIAKAKAAGHSVGGRKPSIDRARVLELNAAGVGPAQIARALGISKRSVSYVLAAARKSPEKPLDTHPLLS